MNRHRVLCTDICDASKEQLTREVRSGFVFPVNLDVMVSLHRDNELWAGLEHERRPVFHTLDSQVLRSLSAVILGRRFVARITGVDFVPYFLQHSPVADRVFFLGGKGDTASRAAHSINIQLGRRLVVDAVSPSMHFAGDAEESRAIAERINSSAASVLVTGVGSPKQEKWMLRMASTMPQVRVFIAVGAALDFWAGNVERAPQKVQQWGLEWFWRLIHEPGRLAGRYLWRDPPVIWWLLKQRLGRYQPPQ